jgi:pimeloyl-ACP methyl ester carboxylesterase
MVIPLVKKCLKLKLTIFQKTHRVIAFDLLGHGQSSKISEMKALNNVEKSMLAEQVYNLPSLIAQAAFILNSLSVSRACILGWSLGGHIAYGLAIVNPKLTSRIITSGTPPINFTSSGLKKGFTAWFANNIVKDWINNPRYFQRREAKAILKNMGFSNVAAEDAYAVDAVIKTDPLLRKFLFSTLKSNQNIMELNLEKFIQKNRLIPVCFLEGELDKGVNITYIKKCFDTYIVHKQSISQYRVLKGLGHASFRENPDKYNKNIVSFLNICL